MHFLVSYFVNQIFKEQMYPVSSMKRLISRFLLSFVRFLTHETAIEIANVDDFVENCSFTCGIFLNFLRKCRFSVVFWPWFYFDDNFEKKNIFLVSAFSVCSVFVFICAKLRQRVTKIQWTNDFKAWPSQRGKLKKIAPFPWEICWGYVPVPACTRILIAYLLDILLSLS